MKLGVSGRIISAFAAVIVAFAAAIALSAGAQAGVLSALDQVQRDEEWARTWLRLASAVREQYIHQAHTIVRGDRTHLEHYFLASDAARAELSKARASAPLEDLPHLERIFEAAVQLDLVFRHQIVPGIEAQDWAKVRAEHERAEAAVEEIVSRVSLLEAASTDRVERARAAAAAKVRFARGLTLGLFAVAVGLAALVGAFVVRSVVRPLRRLGEGARRVGEGDLTTRIGLGTKDELGELSARFDEMAARLKEDRERLLAAEKLASLGRLAAGVAHELNNPLTVVLGYARLLQKSAPAQLARDLRVIGEEVTRCQQIVSELLSLAREGQHQRCEPIDLGSLAGEVVRRQESGALEGAAARVEVALPALPMRGDPDRLTQVVANLLRNAQQAAGEKGHVRLSGRAAHGSVELCVEDDGPGLPPEARSRLFEPFFTTKPQGVGLGLAVSLAIAQGHLGTIEADNLPQGGARFILRLPAGGPR
ncbi:MAG: HAMP domain-containing histidine kinase [Myxococcales bacterium]|nr:HAMP domain-containing histidine kinase [Myxococcales bacterium]